MNCAICYDDLPENQNIRCSDKGCDVVLCLYCFGELLEFCLSESQMIFCPKKECSVHYHLQNIPKALHSKYEDLCTNYLLHFTKSQVDEMNKYETVIQKLRNEKTNFINISFSPAIVKVLNIAYEKELKHVKKSNKAVLDKMLTGRKCIGFMCRGIMELTNEGYLCGLCDTTFCKECEKPTKEFHSCKQDDVDSVKAISELVKCPTCKFPVIKSVGCNYITCAVCRTNFDYISGEKAAHGNHTHDTPLSVREHNTLYELYADDYKTKREVLELFIEIDALMPTSTDVKILSKIIQKQKEKEFDRKDKQILAKKYSQYLQSCMRSKIYRKEVTKIKIAHESGVLCEDLLEEILYNLKHI